MRMRNLMHVIVALLKTSLSLKCAFSEAASTCGIFTISKQLFIRPEMALSAIGSISRSIRSDMCPSQTGVIMYQVKQE